MRRDWSGLFWELVVVVAGIAITFAGQALIDKHYEQKEVRASLSLVCDELRDNIMYVKGQDSVFVSDREAVDFLWKNIGNYYKCNQDTLELFCNRPFSLLIFSESREALELLKNSGVFSKIEDKTLALDIIHVYGYLQDYMGSAKFYSDKKIRMVEDLSDDVEIRDLFGNPAITFPGFWDCITKKEKGNYFLRELRLQLNSRADAKEVIDEVQKVIDKIEAYCK